jgi:DNA invertase Pin-like site-specific DNA recombinase
MDVGLYARVSKEEQAEEGASIDQQIADMKALCERNGWNAAGLFVDCENYRATQNPRRGKIVNPSGERADRPALLELFERLRTGELDAVVCWRDDRLVRHPRVAVALEDVLDIGDSQRGRKSKIGIYDATGAQIDRFTLSIKASIWREENKRRAERSNMGKIATLKQGRWPGSFDRLGYVTTREPGKRGRGIELADPEEVETVKSIFDAYDAGEPLVDIRRKLVQKGVDQKGKGGRHKWMRATIYQILRSEAYIGKAVWQFSDGTEYEIQIPQIVVPEKWKQVQDRLDHGITLSTRNAKGVYLLQGILKCGECGYQVQIEVRRYHHEVLADGTRKRYPYKGEPHQYRCRSLWLDPEKEEIPHPAPRTWNGVALDWEVWRYVVENGINRPEQIEVQILAEREELQRHGESIDGEITHARRRLSEVDQERAFYQRQAARGRITEHEFDARMEETEEAVRYWHAEIERLTDLRDDTQKMQNGIDYTRELLASMRARLYEIDCTPEELAEMPEEKRNEILEERRTMIRSIVDEVKVWSNGDVEVFGLIDGSEGARFKLEGPWKS